MRTLGLLILAALPQFGQTLTWVDLPGQTIQAVTPPIGGGQYAVTAASCAASTATLTLSSALSTVTGNVVTDGQYVYVSGMPSGWNSGSSGVAVTAVSGMTVSYAVSSCPGAGYSGSGGIVGVSINGQIGGNPIYSYPTLASGVTHAWGGAAARTQAGKEALFIWNGGHVDYGGNEIYKLDINLGMLTRVSIPSPITAANYGTCSPTDNDGTPNVGHTYQNFVYMPNVDLIYVSKRGVYCGNGYHYNDTWTLNPDTLAWMAMDPVNCLPLGCGGGVGHPANPYTGSPVSGAPDAYATWDPNTQSLIVVDNYGSGFVVYRYCPAVNSSCAYANQYMELSNNGSPGIPDTTGHQVSTVIDSDTNTLLMIGGGPGQGMAATIPIGTGSSFTPTIITGSIDASCNAVLYAVGPGIVYNPTLKKYVIWLEDGGSTVTVMDPSAFTCTTMTVSGTGPKSTGIVDGLWGRWNYFPSLNAYVAVNDWNVDAMLLEARPRMPRRH
jgi:hypothetical protein